MQMMRDFQLKRLGLLMEAEPGNPNEVEGVLNPAAARGPDGALYLFPRLVGKGNYSRIGIARVRFNDEGDPCAVERLGIALEPEADYELHANGGGCEDARVPFVDCFQRYLERFSFVRSGVPAMADEVDGVLGGDGRHRQADRFDHLVHRPPRQFPQ